MSGRTAPAAVRATFAVQAGWCDGDDMKTERAPTMAELAERRLTVERIAAIHGAANIRVCGSVARGDARTDSDVDLVVDMDDDRDMLDLVELVLDLEHELGRRVDVLRVSRGRPPSRYSPAGAIVAGAVPITAVPPERRRQPSGDQDQRLLQELRQSIALIRSYAQGGEAAFMRNDMAVDAAKHRLGEIANSCKRLSAGLKARHPDIRWRALGGLPVAARHGPRGCWEIITQHLPALDQLIEHEMTS